MDWKMIGRLWLIGLVIFILGCMLIGCGSKQWSPTEPRLAPLDTSKISIEDSWEVDLDVGIKP